MKRTVVAFAALAALGAAPQKVARQGSLEGTIHVVTVNMEEAQRDGYLSRLGLTPDLVLDLDADAHWRLKRSRSASPEDRIDTPWGSFDGGPGWRRVSLFGQSMEVRSRETEDGIRFTDDWGGSRLDVYRAFPEPGCVSEPCYGMALDKSLDDHGPIVEIRRDRHGRPTGSVYGDVLAVRYHYDGESTPEWMEFIDTRTGETILDSRLAPYSSEERTPAFVLKTRNGRTLAKAEAGGPLYVPVYAREIYARLPVGSEGEVWRTLNARAGGMTLIFNLRVDYTDDRVRVFFTDTMSAVIEVPRNAASDDPITLIHPGRALPLVDPEEAYESQVPPRTPPEAMNAYPVVTDPAWLPSIPGSKENAGLMSSVSAARTRMAGGPSGPETDCESTETPGGGGEEMTCTSTKPTVPGAPVGLGGTIPIPGQGGVGQGNPMAGINPVPSNPGGGTQDGGGGGPSLAQQENSAVLKARKRANRKRCSSIYKGHFGTISGAPRLDGTTGPEAWRCARGDYAYSYVNKNGTPILSGAAFAVYMCPAFYGRSTKKQSSTLLHEWAHLAGWEHGELGGSGSSPGMTARINARC